MKKQEMTVLAIAGILGVVGLSGLALTLPQAVKAKQDVQMEKEFVCYDDGALVERHVGVEHAYMQRSAVWVLHYKDRQEAFYAQPLGETCQVEEVARL